MNRTCGRPIDAVPVGVEFDSAAPAYFNHMGNAVLGELEKHYGDVYKRCRPVLLKRLRKLLAYQQRVRLKPGH